MKKKPVLIGSLILVVVLGIGLFVYRNYIAADEVPADFLDSLSSGQNPNDPTVIKLPEKYSKDAIQKALESNSKITSKSVSTMSVDQNEIIKAIRDQAKTTVNQIETNYQIKQKSLPQTERASAGFHPDSVISIADSNGDPVIPNVTSSAVATSVADNFVFDVSVTDKLKNLFIDAYPKLVDAYGQMSDNRPVKVFYDTDLGRSYCYIANKEIHIGALWAGDSPDTVTHELAHAFHGRYGLDSLWEEGMASDITEVVGAGYEWVTSEGYSIENQNNLASFQEKNRENAWEDNFPYYYGARTFNKLYLENKDFYKNFNAELYKTAPTYSTRTPQKRINFIANKVVKTVEGEPTASWFSHQYPFVEMDEQGQEMTNFGVIALCDPVYSWCNYVSITGHGFDTSVDYDIRFLDSSGNILLDKNDFNTVSKWDQCIQKEIVTTSPNFSKYLTYHGLVKVEYNSIHSPGQIITRIVPKTSSTYGFAILSSNGDAILKMTNMENNNVVYAENTNGLYSPDGSIKADGGRFLLQTYRKKKGCSGSADTCLGAKVKEIRYNTSKVSQLNVINLATDNVCKENIIGLKQMNRGFSFTAKSDVDCGHTLFFANAPIKRAWGIEYKFTVNNLQPGKKYSFIDYSAGDYTKMMSKSATANTLSGPDFQLVSAGSSGNPVKNNFRRRFTFNSAIDPSSVHIKLFLDSGMYAEGDGATEVKSNIEYSTDKKILNIVPDKIYNNAGYGIEGLDKVTDLSGNPIYKYDYNNGWFTIPINPAGTETPAYTMASEKIAAGENVVVNMNFQSSQLAGKLGEIELMRNIPIDGCESGDKSKGGGPGSGQDCYSVAVTPRLVGNQIIIPQSSPFDYNLQYNLIMPSVIDNNNNLVELRYLSFTSLPKAGTEGLKIISSDPADGSEIGSISKIIINFNNPVLAGSGYYVAWLGSSYPSDDGSLQVDVSGSTVTLTPKGTISYKGSAFVYLSYLKDVYGNYLNGGFQSFFFKLK